MLPQEILALIFNELSQVVPLAELANDRLVCKSVDSTIVPLLFHRVYEHGFKSGSRLTQKLGYPGKYVQIKLSVRNTAFDVVSDPVLAPRPAKISAWCGFAQSLRQLDDRHREALVDGFLDRRHNIESASVIYYNEDIEPASNRSRHRRVQSLQRDFSFGSPLDQSRYPKVFRQIHINNGDAALDSQKFDLFGFLFAFPGRAICEGVSINVISPSILGNKNKMGVQVPITQRKNLRFMPASIQSSGLDGLLKSYPGLQKLTIHACGATMGDGAPKDDAHFSLHTLGDLLRRHRPALKGLTVDFGQSSIPCHPSAFPIGSIVFLRSLVFISLTEWSLFGMPSPMLRQDERDEDSTPYADFHWVQLTSTLPGTLQRIYILEDENAPAEQSLSYMRNSNAECLNLILSPKFGSLRFVKLDRRIRYGKINRLLDQGRQKNAIPSAFARSKSEFNDEPRDLCYLRPGYAATAEEQAFAVRVEREKDVEYDVLLTHYRDDYKHLGRYYSRNDPKKVIWQPDCV